MSIVKIYTLSDPRNPNEIRYVGKTKQTLSRRLTNHISDSKSRRYKLHTSNWIYSLLREGISPIIEELDSIECELKEDWADLEKYWISQMKCWGFKLTNLTDGGDGNQNQIFSKEAIEKRAKKIKGIPRDEETKRKISESHKGKIKTEEHINNIRKSIIKKQGRPVLQYTKSGEFIKEWECGKEAAMFYNVDPSSLMRCCQGKFKSSAGYVWKYKNEKIV